MKQSYKIYENLLSAVAVYRAGATKHSTFYKVRQQTGLGGLNISQLVILITVFVHEIYSHC